MEQSLIHAVLAGLASPSVVDPAELSPLGQAVLKVVQALPSPPPHDVRTVLLGAVEVFGADRESMRGYLKQVKATGPARGVDEILRLVREKQTLVGLINAAGEQLQTGRLDVGVLAGHLALEPRGGAGLLAVAEAVKDGLPPIPEGLPLPSLPRLAALTGGLYGVWAIAGEPGCGKSTLAWQLALDASKAQPVLYYDFENGFPILMSRARSVFDDDLAKIREATGRVYVRESVRTLEADLTTLATPCLVVIDSIQKLPSSILHRREGLDSWVHRLEGLKHRGHTVLLISEVPRGSYGHEPSVGDFKETGEIEYSADLGARVVRTGDTDADVYIVKNRHHPHQGFAVSLTRVRSWSFREAVSAPDLMSTITWEDL